MSLYGALYAGVAGLQAQSNKLGIISDNVANVNTVGYKAASASFETLVTNASNTTAYSPGGVLGGNQQLVDTQGLLTTTSSPTDIAISGSGLFVVNQKADDTGQVLYTRAGSFVQDAQGNFANASGYFLQAWPLDRDGKLPGAPGNSNTTSSANLASLQTVNVQNISGTAAATSSVSLGANLNASQTAFAGAAGSVTMDASDAENFGIKANDVIIPTAIDSLTRGDAFTVSTGTNSTGFTYTYDGFTFGRDITDRTAGGDGDNAQDLVQNSLTLAINKVVTTGGGSAEVTIETPSAHHLAVGDVVTLANVTVGAGGITPANLTGSFVVTGITSATKFTIDSLGTDPGGADTGGNAGITVRTRQFAATGAILDAINKTQSFLGTTGTSGFTAAALTFKINTAASGEVTFTYTSSSPNAQSLQFNNLTNLAEAISTVDGLTARVGTDNRLYVGATDANAAVTFTNGATTGIDGPPVQAAIDWKRELGLEDIAVGTNRFSTMQSLADLVNASAGLSATVNSPLGTSSIDINVDDPLDTITFTDADYGAAPNTGSPLAALGLIDSLASVVPVGTGATTSAIGPSYDPTDETKNMAAGGVSPQFSRPVTVFDAQGAPHNLNIAFLKTSVNTWAVEIYAQPAEDVTNRTDGQVSRGTMTFNSDGSLRSVSSALSQPITINWTNGAGSSEITYNWGTSDTTDGLSQFSSSFNVNFVNQNGAPKGQLTGVSIDASGFITASYSNGETQRLYKIPLAVFTDPNHLQSISGNAFSQTSGSGEVNLKEAGQSGVGTISSGALEASNVELANQLTDMIVAQRAYQACTKVISTSDQLLSDLGQIIR